MSSLDYNLLKQVTDSVTEKGYTQIDRDLLVFGGRNNGVVDLMATDNENKKILIIEVKDNPIHVYDISMFYKLKKNIENKFKNFQLHFFLLTTEKDTSSQIKNIAKKENIIINNLNEFVSLKNI